MRRTTDGPFLTLPSAVSNPQLAAGYAAILSAQERGADLLTRRGLAQVRRALCAREGQAAGTMSAPPVCPVWDRRQRRLWLGDRLLRQFGRRAPGQWAILDAFQVGRWTLDPVADPIPREPGEDASAAARRLRETVKNLNRGLPRHSIRFREDGKLVWWQPVDPGGP